MYPFPFSCQITDLFNYTGMILKLPDFHLDVLKGTCNLRCPKLNLHPSPTNPLLPQPSSILVRQAESPWTALDPHPILHHGKQTPCSSPTKPSPNLTTSPHFHCYHSRPGCRLPLLILSYYSLNIILIFPSFDPCFFQAYHQHGSQIDSV